MVGEMKHQPKSAVWYFWHPNDQRWYDVIAAGDASITEWVAILRAAGYCICKVKRRA